MVAATLSVVLLLGVGIPSLVGGMSAINESRSIETGDDASVALIVGFLAVAFGSSLCLVAEVVSLVFLGAGFASWLLEWHKDEKQAARKQL